jgi:hypothetical protein
MTTALKNAFSKINHLPAREQNAIARLLMDELVWQKSYEKSQKQLTSLVAEALSEYRAGKTRPLNLK